jgi:hypothetical protein
MVGMHFIYFVKNIEEFSQGDFSEKLLPEYSR